MKVPVFRAPLYRVPLYRLVRQLSRICFLILMVGLGTIALMRFAPGYFSDTREMDAQYAASARAQLETQRQQQTSLVQLTSSVLHGWLHGDLGRSRQYDVPVTELIEPRLRITINLLLRGVGWGWLAAIALALPLSAKRGRSTAAILAAPFAVLLAVPIGALATLSLLTNFGGPVLVLAVLIGTRDFKFLYRLFRQGWRDPSLFTARAQGIRPSRIAWKHLLPAMMPQLLALALMSLVVALGAIVPVEVIFNVPGLGQLAWSAAMNRDLPVLLAVTLGIAAIVGCAGNFAEPARVLERT